MENILKSILITATAVCSFNSYANGLNIVTDPSLLVAGNSLEISYRIYSCDNKLVCPFNQNYKVAASSTIPAEYVQEFSDKMRDVFLSDLPAHSTLNNADSFISFDILKNGMKLSLPGCYKIINGMNNIIVNITPTGCTIS